MKELVGNCFSCNKEVFCLDGFLNGVVDDTKIYCFECHTNATSDNDYTQNKGTL